jgi:hypothetical protein
MIPSKPAGMMAFLSTLRLFARELSMRGNEETESQIVAVHAEAPAERLFFGQYRLWMAAHSSRDPLYLDYAFKALLNFVACDAAKELFCEFSWFTGTLTEQTRRPIGWRLSRCRCLCRDEFLALCLVAASQRNDLAGQHAAASGLLGTEYVTPLLTASGSLAQALEFRGFILAPVERMTAGATMPPIRSGWTLR